MPRQKVTVAPIALCRALVVIGTLNSTSSGRPAIAGLRSRTAIRSAATAISPIPAAASSPTPLIPGTGGRRAHSSAPWLARSHRFRSEFFVGTIQPADSGPANTRFRYSSRPAR